MTITPYYVFDIRSIRPPIMVRANITFLHENHSLFNLGEIILILRRVKQHFYYFTCSHFTPKLPFFYPRQKYNYLIVFIAFIRAMVASSIFTHSRGNLVFLIFFVISIGGGNLFFLIY